MLEDIQTEIRNVFEVNESDNEKKFKHLIYSRSVTQKLWASQYCLNNLHDIDINNFTEEPSDSATQSSTPIYVQDSSLNIQKFWRTLNLYLDGFFMISKSALDSLAHEISILYRLDRQRNNKYITDIADQINNNNLKISQFLYRQLCSPSWFDDYNDYRNCTTHESLIPFTQINYKYDPATNKSVLTKRLKLPDNPRDMHFQYRKRREPFDYCNKTLKRIWKLVEKAYENILDDIKRSHNTFPITI